jgi:hypothetical protein
MHHNERNSPNVLKVYPALSTQVQDSVTERSTTQNGWTFIGKGSIDS